MTPTDTKQQHNIVDVINQYVPLKKQGKDHFGCCPFHGEKTPSFSVSEDKQFFYCFGCGAKGDVIDFVMQYQAVDFKDAIKILGGDAQDYVRSTQNKKRFMNGRPVANVPCDDKRDMQKTTESLHNATQSSDNGLTLHNLQGKHYMPLQTITGDVVNAVCVVNGLDFLAGGISYGAFTLMENNTDKYMACTSLDTGKWLHQNTICNVLVCYTTHNLKYVVMWHTPDTQVVPVLTAEDDDYLAYEMTHGWFENSRLEKRDAIDVSASA